jgi:hypothetical protein
LITRNGQSVQAQPSAVKCHDAKGKMAKKDMCPTAEAAPAKAATPAKR